MCYNKLVADIKQELLSPQRNVVLNALENLAVDWDGYLDAVFDTALSLVEGDDEEISVATITTFAEAEQALCKENQQRLAKVLDKIAISSGTGSVGITVSLSAREALKKILDHRCWERGMAYQAHLRKCRK